MGIIDTSLTRYVGNHPELRPVPFLITERTPIMFHKSNLGSFGLHLPCDLDGYVPQEGDAIGQFAFASGEEPEDDEEFAAWVADAVERTAEATRRLKTWQESNG